MKSKNKNKDKNKKKLLIQAIKSGQVTARQIRAHIEAGDIYPEDVK